MEDDMNRRSLVIALATLTAAVAPKLAHTESYPSRPVTLVVPYAAGGTFDVIARIVATRMGELLGQPVIVENTTGAGGVVGVTRVMHAKPDGYTILLGTVGTHAYNQWIYKKRRYDALEDFTPVTLFSEQPMVLEVRKDLPANSFPEFIALLKKDGSKMQFGSAGAGTTTHLACALLNARIGANVTHVPYRGSAPATNDLIGGQIDYVCGNIGAAIGLIKANRVKALAMLSKERSSLMPELPTPHEMGIADYDVTTWTALFLPKGAPREIVDKLAEVTQATMETPAVKTRMLEIGVTGVSKDRQSPEYLSKYVAEEIARWEAPIKSGGLQVE
jgi:tripartite-type tricarboxylate transporter receptor subunit TctC